MRSQALLVHNRDPAYRAQNGSQQVQVCYFAIQAVYGVRMPLRALHIQSSNCAEVGGRMSFLFVC